MIIKIDHLAFSSADFKRETEILRQLGYRQVFLQKKIKNLMIKKTLMKNFNNFQDLALFEKEGCAGIELVNHHNINLKESSYLAIFDNLPKEFIAERQNNIRVNGFIMIKIKYWNIMTYFRNDGKHKDFKFNKIVSETSNIKKSISFWKNFGFRFLGREGSIPSLEFNSLVKNEYFKIYLDKRSQAKPDYFLDDKGFNCLAFITNSAIEERERLKKNNIRVTDIENIFLNNKALEVFFALGSNGELVEIIGLKV